MFTRGFLTTQDGHITAAEQKMYICVEAGVRMANAGMWQLHSPSVVEQGNYFASAVWRYGSQPWIHYGCFWLAAVLRFHSQGYQGLE